MLGNLGTWTVNGIIYSESGIGIQLAAGPVGTSKITIGEDGEVEGAQAIELGERQPSRIRVSSKPIPLRPASQRADKDDHQFRQHFREHLFDSRPRRRQRHHYEFGNISGKVSLGGGNDKLANTGQIFDDVDLGDGTNILTISAVFSGDATGGSGADTIDFQFMDANSTNGTDIDDFSNTILVHGNFSGVTGEIRVYMISKGWIVEGNTNADKTADFAIDVRDENRSIIWMAADFNLWRSRR